MRSAVLSLLAIAIAGAGCGGDDETASGPPPSAPEEIRLASPALTADQPIPKRYTCDGDEVAPPLRWRGVPDDARELVLLMEDPDAPGGTFVHWTAFGLPPTATELPEGGKLPGRAATGENSFGDDGYGGPCPPEGDDPHRYVFLLYALPTESGLEQGASPQAVRDTVEEAAPLASGRLEASFGR